jgi:hypothetical protein
MEYKQLSHSNVGALAQIKSLSSQLNALAEKKINIAVNIVLIVYS